MGTANSVHRTSEPDVARHLTRHDGHLATGRRPGSPAASPDISVIPAPRNTSIPAPRNTPRRTAGGVHRATGATGAGADPSARVVPMPSTPGVHVLADPASGWREAPAAGLPAWPTGDPAGAVLPRRLMRGPDRLGSHRAPRSVLRRHPGVVLLAVILATAGAWALWS